jgi:hypothetical protein
MTRVTTILATVIVAAPSPAADSADDHFEAVIRPLLIENCHWGGTVPNATWCPWNYFRSSGDIRASYDAVVGNLQTTIQWAKAGLSYPGCWAYPDMLEVGCQHGPGGPSDPGLSYTEARTHFNAWCIVSSPLILSHDMTNDTVSDAVWPIITNTDAIGVNQAWEGSAPGGGLGGLLTQSTDTVVLQHCAWIWAGDPNCTLPVEQQLYKPLPGGGGTDQVPIPWAPVGPPRRH